MDVELRHLRAFAAVAQHLSFTRAAEQLRVTQPALTRTIKQLEAGLDVTLLERDTRRVALTAVGTVFLEGAQEVLSALERALTSVREHVTIKLGFSWLLPDPWAQDAVAGYEEATGNRVAIIRIDDPWSSLGRGEVDFAVVRGERRPPEPIRVVRLFNETRIAAFSVRSPLAARSSFDWNEAAGWPLVVNSISGTTGPWSWRDGEGPATVIETSNLDEWLEHIAANRGIGIAPEPVMRRSIHPSVRFLPLDNAPPSPVLLAFDPTTNRRLKTGFIEAAVAAARRATPP